MPAKSKAQQHLFGAAAHGAQFPMAQKVRASMDKSDLRDFASTKTSSLPEHAPKRPSALQRMAGG